MTDSVAESSIVIEKNSDNGGVLPKIADTHSGKWCEANAGVSGGHAGAKYLKEEPFPPSLRQKQTAEEL